jgi:DNA processing protein
MVKGCHRLIQQGAKLVETTADILEELGALATIASPPTAEEPPIDLSALDEDLRDLLFHLGHGPVSVDWLVERCGLTAEAVSSMLLILELQGLVTAAPGGLYSRLRI